MPTPGAVLLGLGSLIVLGAQAALASYGPVLNLPGLAFKPSYNMYSGYVNYTSPELKSTHYTFHWIVEPEGVDVATAPIAFWTNGGMCLCWLNSFAVLIRTPRVSELVVRVMRCVLTATF